MTPRSFFWLHVKKSGGSTTRKLLSPYYVEVDRSRRPPNFIQSPPEEYNDILNNYRMVLGEYQFKRCLFAKTYLYPQTWDDILSFAFSREPISRCVSMFHYLYFNNTKLRKKISMAMKSFFHSGRICSFNSYSFDIFLQLITQSHTSNSIYSPISNHFTTHTTSMWDDITDLNGEILLKKIFRLESLTKGINAVFKDCRISKKVDPYIVLNKNKQKTYNPSKKQITIIKKIYKHDFELYENAIH